MDRMAQDNQRLSRRRRIERFRAAARSEWSEARLGVLWGGMAWLVSGALFAWVTGISFLLVLPIAAAIGATLGYLLGPGVAQLPTWLP